MDIDLTQYDLSVVTNVETIKTVHHERFYDITLSDNHMFFVKAGDKLILTHNCDGHHICGLFLGACYKYLKPLFEQNRIVRFITPLAVAYDNKGKAKKLFFSLEELKQYNNENNYRVKYYKGLGSWKKEELQAIIDIQGVDSLMQPFVIDEQAEQYFNWWLATKETDKRKEFIQNYTLDLEMV